MGLRSRLGVVVLVAACGGGSDGPTADVTTAIAWAAAGTPVAPAHLGHNTVWSRGGLGVWDEAARAVRAEVGAAVAELRPGALRFPGGTRAMRYHFDGAIGPVAGRTAQCDAFSGGFDATTWGPDEFLAWAVELGAEVSLVAPWVDGSAQETAALVAYVNGDPASTVVLGVDVHGKDWGTAGEWAARRVANGRAEPWGVRWIEVGNEPYLSQQVGPDVSCGRPSTFRQSERWIDGVAVPTTAADYAAVVVETAALVRQIDPDIRIAAVAYASFDGVSDARDELGDVDAARGTGDAWNRRLVADAGDAFDVLVLHPYDFGVGDSRVALADRLAKVAGELRALAPDKGLAVTEFGFFLGGGTLLNALVSADMVRAGIELGLELNLRHILIEDDPSGPFAESAALLGASHTRMPGYLAVAGVAQALAGTTTAVPVEIAGAETTGERALTVLAARDAEATRVALVIVDRRLAPGEPRRVAVPLPAAAGGAWTGTVRVLRGAAPESGPEGVTIDEMAVAPAGDTLVVEVPGASVVTVGLRR